jgi:transcriptional regulator NrdR family protein
MFCCEKRNNNDDNENYRKRKCHDCGQDFYTVEFVAEENESFVKAWRKAGRRSK